LEENVRAGKVRVLALFSDRRIRQFPDIPTTLELKYSTLRGPSASVWHFIAARGVPEDRLKTLREIFEKAEKDETFVRYAPNLG